MGRAPSGKYRTATGARRALVWALLSRRDAFLAYLERRTRDRAVAGSILEDAYARGIHEAALLADEDAAVRWFFAVLRHAAVDAARVWPAAALSLDALAGEVGTAAAYTPEGEGDPGASTDPAAWAAFRWAPQRCVVAPFCAACRRFPRPVPDVGLKTRRGPLNPPCVDSAARCRGEWIRTTDPQTPSLVR